MKILSAGEFVEYKNNLYINENKISFTTGKLVQLHKDAKYIVPGFIDQHIHGAGGFDVMDNDKNAIGEIAKLLPMEGTTSFLATTMTCSIEDITRSLEYVLDATKKSSGARVLGAHLEGPFISGDYIGAQNPQYLQQLNIDLLNNINKDQIIKMVTYAPEYDKNHLFLKNLIANNITPSVGHSGATCDCVTQAFNHGLKCITHFHNAQSGHHHRNPGVVTAGFLNNINVELIVDKIHLAPDTLQMIEHTKKHDNIILVTDAMNAKCMKDGHYKLGGLNVIKKGNEARLENGALAGSVLRLIDGVKNYHEITSLELAKIIELVTINPAKNLNIDNIGLIEEGYYFDITILDENLDVVQTFVDGDVKYER